MNTDEIAAVRKDRAEIEQQLEDLDARLKPLQDERRALIDDLRAADELIAELAETDAEIAASRFTDTGSDRFKALVTAMHPAMIDTLEWSPNGRYAIEPGDSVPTPRLYLLLGADGEYIATLADALVSYAERFLADLLPADNRLYAVELLAHDYGEEHKWWLTIDPSARTAVLVDERRLSAEPVRGPLADVLGVAAELAWGRARGDF